MKKFPFYFFVCLVRWKKRYIDRSPNRYTGNKYLNFIFHNSRLRYLSLVAVPQNIFFWIRLDCCTASVRTHLLSWPAQSPFFPKFPWRDPWRPPLFSQYCLVSIHVSCVLVEMPKPCESQVPPRLLPARRIEASSFFLSSVVGLAKWGRNML